MGVIKEIVARDLCPDNFYYSNGRCYRDSAWYWWGRWALAGAVVLAVVLLFFIFACIKARRRRKHGLNPTYGTGWMAPAGKYGQHQQQWGGAYGNQQQPQQYGLPKYGEQTGPAGNYQYGPQAGGGVNPQYTGTTFQPSDGYYGGQHDGVQSPPNTYQGVYSPPTGPPPGK